MELYSRHELSNGDPIVVYDPETGETQMLGTGWHSWDELESELEYVYKNGHETRTIGPNNAEWLSNCSGELEVFEVAANVDFGD